jgi:superfamily II DNA or RNA helicase
VDGIAVTSSEGAADCWRASSVTRTSPRHKRRIIGCAEEHPHHIGVPRGCLEDVRQVLTDLNIRSVIHDERCGGRLLELTFQGQLRPEQKLAADAMLKHEIGVLSATTAFGKTVVAAWLIAQRRINTLVLVHRRQLLDQWVERLATFLELPAKSIGRIGGGRNKSTGLLDVGVIQSLVRNGVVDDRVSDYGQVIVDECHHLAHSFEQVVRRAKARFVAGLSATVTRKDTFIQRAAHLPTDGLSSKRFTSSWLMTRPGVVSHANPLKVVQAFSRSLSAPFSD